MWWKTMLCAVLLLVSPGCSTWQQIPPGRELGEERRDLGTIRAVLRDGKAVQLLNAYTSGDSLYGTWSDPKMVGKVYPARRDSVIALTEVRRLESAKVSPPHTLMFGVLLAGLALGLMYLDTLDDVW